MKLILTIIFLLIPKLCYGAGAYLVDDAGVVDEKTVQSENWYSRSVTGEDIYVINPAYQIFTNAEFSIQETYAADSSKTNSLWPQIKYLWHEDKEKKIASSIVVGFNYLTNDQKTYGNYIYIPLSIKINKLVNLNFNVGWQNWRHSAPDNQSKDSFVYGMGAEIFITDKLSFIPEFIQNNGERDPGLGANPAGQFGFRYVKSDKLIFDAIYGKNINGNQSSWLTIGATFYFNLNPF